MDNPQTIEETPRKQTEIEKLAERESFGTAYDRYHSGKGTEADRNIIAKTFVDRFKADYAELRNDPTMLYRVGLEAINEARPLIENYLKELNKKAKKETGCGDK